MELRAEQSSEVLPSTIDTSTSSNHFNKLLLPKNDVGANSGTSCVVSWQQHALYNEYFALRHGQSDANVAGIIASHPDVARTKYGLSVPTGRNQAMHAGQDVVDHYLQNVNYDSLVLLSSDLLRAYETATIVLEAVLRYNNGVAAMTSRDGNCKTISIHQNRVITDVRLRERGFGLWDGTSDQNYSLVWNDDAIDACHTKHNVESVHSVMERVTRCVVEWDGNLNLSRSDGVINNKTMVVVIAHGDVLQILQTAFAQWPGTHHRYIPHLETATLRPLNMTNDPAQSRK
jgi:glucosyl-3-phosphoglycerate phosphatase